MNLKMVKKLNSSLLGMLFFISASSFGQNLDSWSQRTSWSSNPNYVIKPSTSCMQSDDIVFCSLIKANVMIDELYPKIPALDYATLYLPVLLSSQNAIDLLSVSGPWSPDTRDAVLEFVNATEKIKKNIMGLLTTPQQNKNGRDLLASIRRIKLALDGLVK